MLEVFLPMLISFFIVVALSPICIPLLRRLKMGNTEREYIKEHKAKNGTPSMGGIMILIAFAVVGLFFARTAPHIYPIVFLTVGFGVLGFVDDLLKALKRSSDGLKAWQKMLGQIVLTTGFAVYMVKFSDVSLELRIPATGAFVDISWLSVPLLFLAVLGTVNGANFTDGLDGLATSVTLAIAGFWGLVAIHLSSDITPAIAAMIGALFGFLMFNVHPAKIFMGDTGSLALGAFVVSVAYTLQMPIFIIVVALIYLAEVLSVILQVGYFKMTGGKRIFRMAPIHHHYELGGWSEVKVVAVFTTVTIFLCTFAYFLV
ncbi:phospho-N-acetylmuramoyl-pentapeptide-transferase [Pseudobutyrivibrio xylanivorans]|uniref:Phospho-N-acetylmuramoyl-pentapeptide-transferase n=1 Tax=Pseudobutyrivibrio xylanivorans DSM 14809 TaxID=1123012 RepID=A0A1M6CKB6_PSEXY|nr:phospho-N-acetylmuramoyl-pentapeptide-transferase [Pseudobutyrivibrio xylanivorans]SHI61311.1 Phospho-N-acetylmuramoyl-pentapeptide-transferase [Pseudobutyrivibrio xylanivorans DSM 14809]